MIFPLLAIGGAAAAGYLYHRQVSAAVPSVDEELPDEPGEGIGTVTAADLRGMADVDYRTRVVQALAVRALKAENYAGDEEKAATMTAAHAARETGWYIHTARTASKESNNLFGINATASQAKVEGRDAGNVRQFAAYPDIESGIRAYIKLIRTAYPVAFDRLDGEDTYGYSWALKYGQPKRSYYELDLEGFASPMKSIYAKVEAYVYD